MVAPRRPKYQARYHSAFLNGDTRRVLIMQLIILPRSQKESGTEYSTPPGQLRVADNSRSDRKDPYGDFGPSATGRLTRTILPGGFSPVKIFRFRFASNASSLRLNQSIKLLFGITRVRVCTCTRSLALVSFLLITLSLLLISQFEDKKIADTSQAVTLAT